MANIVANIIKKPDGFTIDFGENSIEITTNHISEANTIYNDFAAWLLLPIAMRTGKNLLINGAGTPTTTRNAQMLSRVWESWMPTHFRSVEVGFQKLIERPGATPRKELCFFSGGVDSTHALLRRVSDGMQRDLLTVHGMEYKPGDEARFQAFREHTTAFSSKVTDTHIIAKTNAYTTYDKYHINLPGIHITHIFALTGIGFLFSENYDRIAIAADYRQDQQFISHPWGSNSVTNRHFSDGQTSLFTYDDDLTRSEKMPLISSSTTALSSLTFCTDYKSRPKNCGVCQKCVRTKLMFMSTTGSVPDIFLENSISQDWYLEFDTKKNYQRAFLIDVLHSAQAAGREHQIPGWGAAWEHVRRPPKPKTALARFIKSFSPTSGHRS